MRILYIPKKLEPVTVKYGLLYNWYAVDDARHILSEGWHIPTYTEYQKLRASTKNIYSVMDVDEYWSETGGGTNTCGWNGRGSGKRVHDTGLFITLGEQADYWTVPENGTNTALKFYLYGYDDYFSYQTSNDKKNGFSVRPIKDTTTLSHGQTGTYTGNDGRIYRTICIDSQEWLADNLCETKYRNGDTIPEVTDNTAWAALTTGALCAYNNDHNNI